MVVLALAIAGDSAFRWRQDVVARRGLLTEEQTEEIVEKLGTAQANSVDALSVLCIANWQKAKSNALLGGLQGLFTALGWNAIVPGPNGWNDVPQPQHKGVIVYAKTRRPGLDKTVAALKAAGVDIEYGEGQPVEFGDGFGAIFSVGVIK